MPATGIAGNEPESICQQSDSQTAFGKPLSKVNGNYDKIVLAYINMYMARLPTLWTGCIIGARVVRQARNWISGNKAAVANIALETVDDAIQIHAAA